MEKIVPSLKLSLTGLLLRNLLKNWNRHATDDSVKRFTSHTMLDIARFSDPA